MNFPLAGMASYGGSSLSTGDVVEMMDSISS